MNENTAAALGCQSKIDSPPPFFKLFIKNNIGNNYNNIFLNPKLSE